MDSILTNLIGYKTCLLFNSLKWKSLHIPLSLSDWYYQWNGRYRILMRWTRTEAEFLFIECVSHDYILEGETHLAGSFIALTFGKNLVSKPGNRNDFMRNFTISWQRFRPHFVKCEFVRWPWSRLAQLSSLINRSVPAWPTRLDLLMPFSIRRISCLRLQVTNLSRDMAPGANACYRPIEFLGLWQVADPNSNNRRNHSHKLYTCNQS